MRIPTQPSGPMKLLRWLILVRITLGLSIYFLILVVTRTTLSSRSTNAPPMVAMTFGLLMGGLLISVFTFIFVLIVGGLSIAILEVALALLNVVPRVIPYSALLGGTIAFIFSLPFLVYQPHNAPRQVLVQAVLTGPIGMLVICQVAGVAGALRFAREDAALTPSRSKLFGKMRFGIGKLISLTAMIACGFALFRSFWLANSSALSVVVLFWVISFGVIYTISRMQPDDVAVSQLAPIKVE